MRMDNAQAIANKRRIDAAYTRLRAHLMNASPVCAACGVRLAAEMDHITPLHRGGADDISNVQALCKPCHAEKTAGELSHLHRKGLRICEHGTPQGLDNWTCPECAASNAGV